LGNVSTIAINKFSGSVYGTRVQGSAIGDVKYQMYRDKVIYGIELPIQTATGTKTVFIAYPEISSAVHQMTGGKLDSIPRSTLPRITKEDFVRLQLKQLPPIPIINSRKH